MVVVRPPFATVAMPSSPWSVQRLLLESVVRSGHSDPVHGRQRESGRGVSLAAFKALLPCRREMIDLSTSRAHRSSHSKVRPARHRKTPRSICTRMQAAPSFESSSRARTLRSTVFNYSCVLPALLFMHACMREQEKTNVTMTHPCKL
jgi:hypothetical protein